MPCLPTTLPQIGAVAGLCLRYYERKAMAIHWVTVAVAGGKKGGGGLYQLAWTAAKEVWPV